MEAGGTQPPSPRQEIPPAPRLTGNATGKTWVSKPDNQQLIAVCHSGPDPEYTAYSAVRHQFREPGQTPVSPATGAYLPALSGQ